MKAVTLALLWTVLAAVAARADVTEVVRYNLLVLPMGTWPEACGTALDAYDDLEPVADDYHPVIEFHFHGLDDPASSKIFVETEILLPLPVSERAKVSVSTPELFMQLLYTNTFSGPSAELESLCARAAAALHAQLVGSPMLHRDRPDDPEG